MPHLWILTCLLGFTCLQATEVSSIDALEGSHKDGKRLVIDESVFESVYAFVYTNNADTKFDKTFPSSDGYTSKNPVVFSAVGPAERITYNSKTGELTVPLAGSYEIVYSVNAYVSNVALAVNGKVVEASIIKANDIVANTFVLKLNAGDRVTLVLPGSPKNVLFGRNTGEGHSVSMFMQKI
jgi:hypothetical protein